MQCQTRTAALISAFDAVDVKILGHAPDALGAAPAVSGYGLDASEYASSSVLDGQGCEWWKAKAHNNISICRPELLNFVNCTGVEVSNVVATDSAFWTTHFVYSTDVWIHNFSVKTSWKQPKCAGPKPGYGGTNTDGIDVDSSKNVLIERVYIDTGDDAIALKSGEDEA